jgi:anhydro-N-acetylmuramic acid kinase
MAGYKVIGLMSGTSLDGIDVACCEFIYRQKWEFDILFAETISYNNEWENRLKNLHFSNGEKLVSTHVEYGKLLGEIVNQVISKTGFKPDFISSHGHTIFHRPDQGYTWQIGDGNFIAAITGIPVIYDFRMADVALGGQGAPLVPIGDRLLFGDFGFCLNLGGISNVSFEKNDQRIAFDICPVNMVLNYLANKAGFPYDHKGQLASHGHLNQQLLNDLNTLGFYSMKPPKSLGREWVEEYVFRIIGRRIDPLENLLRTYTEHIAIQISRIINPLANDKILVTGGGTKNDFLIDRIKANVNSEIIIPQNNIVDYKEALIFAFLGILRWRNEINCVASVTGATRDSSCGVIAHP